MQWYTLTLLAWSLNGLTEITYDSSRPNTYIYATESVQPYLK